jgi:hypothetical protein
MNYMSIKDLSEWRAAGQIFGDRFLSENFLFDPSINKSKCFLAY